MEPLSETQWDVTIAGTGLAQSLLALALSRSGKKVLHVDKNPYYGGAEAAFSLQEAEQWVEQVNKDPSHGPFEEAFIKPPSENRGNVGSSRAYTISLSPHVIYTRSALIPNLVSSKVYKQLEFQAVGSWWVYRPSNSPEDNATSDNLASCLHRVPSSREDVFADQSIPVRDKRALMKFLRTLLQPVDEDEEETEVLCEEALDESFADYLTSQFRVPADLQDPLLSLSLSQESAHETSADYAVTRIKRHLSSIGVFGPGFGGLLTKWGGSSEIAQVGCRALAVGGGVYVLNRGIQSIPVCNGVSPEEPRLQLRLSDDEPIHTRFVVGSKWDLPSESSLDVGLSKVARAIFIVSSPLSELFPPTAEGGPIPAGCVVVTPGQQLTQNNEKDAPVHLLIHSSETGECPDGQCVIYGNVGVPGTGGHQLLEEAVDKVLASFTTAESQPAVLWSLHYTQLGTLHQGSGDPTTLDTKDSASDSVICLDPPSLDLAFDDTVISEVKAIWKRVVGDEVQDHDFMAFEDRAGTDVDDEISDV